MSLAIPPISIRCMSLLLCSLILLIVIFNITTFRLQPSSRADERRHRGNDAQQLAAKVATQNKGMVMCVGNDDGLIAGALHTVQLIRETFKSELPVSINHCSELSKQTELLFTQYDFVTVRNMCNKKTKKEERARLKGWFCKTMALISSPFEETMIVDTDVLWFKDPTQLFHAPNYLSTGALFFRDRFLYESASEKDGLTMDVVTKFIQTESRQNVIINAETAKILSESNGVNFFWWNAHNSTKYKAIRHVQESSVIILDKSRHPKTLAVLSRLFLTFNLGTVQYVALDVMP